MKTLIFGGRVVDPANRVDNLLNLLIEDGKIAWASMKQFAVDQKIHISADDQYDLVASMKMGLF